LIGAGLFVFGGILLTGVAAVRILPGLPPAIVGIGTGLLIPPLVGLAYLIFGERLQVANGKSVSLQLSELREAGLLETEHFSVTRAFEVEEAEDEGMHFFLELPAGAVLYLTGQYLYEYEPGDSTGEAEQRQFPCSDFTIHRHSKERYVVELVCRGSGVEPDCLAPPFTDTKLEELDWPQDGRTWTDRSYDDLKSALVRAG